MNDFIKYEFYTLSKKYVMLKGGVIENYEFEIKRPISRNSNDKSVK